MVELGGGRKNKGFPLLNISIQNATILLHPDLYKV